MTEANQKSLRTIGLEEPLVDNPSRGVTEVALPKYDGSPLTWFRWIRELKSIIQETELYPEQKLTVLSNHLSPEDRKLMLSVGGRSFPIRTENVEESMW